MNDAKLVKKIENLQKHNKKLAAKIKRQKAEITRLFAVEKIGERKKKMTEINKIEELIQEELKEANEKFPAFASKHEAYAVAKEEVEELHEEVVACEGLMLDMWYRIRNDWWAEDLLRQLKTHAIHAAQEAIQVAAMAQKALDSLGERR